MPEIKKLFIKHNDIDLEAELFKSDFQEEKIAVLVVHPHPSYGGNMHNNVVSAIFKKFTDNKRTILRFNFRGVGASKGTYSGDSGELNDAKACIDYLIFNLECEKVFLCGYSYGAAIGCSLVNYSERIIGYCAISFPWDFMGMKYKNLSQTIKPKLFIQGDRDEIAYYSAFETHYESYSNPKNKIIIKGADHFYWGFENLIANEVFEFVTSLD